VQLPQQWLQRTCSGNGMLRLQQAQQRWCLQEL
jgi:hypothetical protein